MWVANHKCMEAMLGISLSSYLYLNLAKMTTCFLSLIKVFSSTKSENRRTEKVLPRSWGGVREWGSGTNNVYICK
jgi:hypothetical protein